MGDAIVRRADDGDQRSELGERFDRCEGGTDRECGTRDAICHPSWNRSRRVIGLTQPHVVTMTHAASSEHGLAVQRMPRIVNRDALSVVGRM
jgi:hypothetical protein